MSTAWSFLTLEPGDRQFVGNEGYPDILGSQYVFDSTVANHGAVQEGDLAVLRDGAVVLGVGWIDQISSRSGLKSRLRCPNCHSTGFKRRKSLDPPFFCSKCQTPFVAPAEESLDVTVYLASYGRTWRPADERILVSALSNAYLSRALQQSIRRLDLPLAQDALLKSMGIGGTWWAPEGGLQPAMPGGHVTRLGQFRIGQQRFREELLGRFGCVCAFTGPQPAGALQAAHLYRYCDTPSHEATGGLLLRADLHALFDRWLITIDPTSWTVRISPALASFPALVAMEGTTLKVPAKLRPDVGHIKTHFTLAMQAWADPTS